MAETHTTTTGSAQGATPAPTSPIGTPGDVGVDVTQRLMDATTGALELYTVYIGTQLGLYGTLDRHGPQSSAVLADRAGIHERYAREWLEQQAVAGYLVVDGDIAVDDTARRYALPAEHRGALADPLDGDHLAPFASMLVGIGGVLGDVVDAFRTGEGVPFDRYGADLRRGQGAINRPAFTTDLVKSWLPAVDGVAERLAGGGRLVDIGCGVGWSAIAVKAAWPAADVVGLDTDVASIDEARANADEAGVDVRLEVARDGRGGGIGDVGPADVLLVLEALHDMSHPADVLRAARSALAPGGVVVIADEAVADTFTAPGDDLERMMYGWSVTHCLPASMAEEGSAAIGTAIRHDTIAGLAEAAGFASCEVVDVDGGFFRIYRLAG